jgi:phytoene synthase
MQKMRYLYRPERFVGSTLIRSSHHLLGESVDMQKTREIIELDSAAIERGYKSCRTAVKQFYRGYLWIASNLPGDQRKALDAVLCNLSRSIDMFDLESNNGLSLDVWHEFRDDLSDAFLDKCTSVELAALADTVRKYEIPKQFVFDPFVGVDIWIRNRRFETFEELATFASLVGGSTMAAATPILGTIKSGYEVAAIECGKGIFLVQMLANCVEHLRSNKVFLAQQDLESCEVVLERLKLRQGGDPLKHLVRLYCSRIEKIFYEGGKLAQYLDFDGRRSLTSLLAVHWRMLMEMEREPESLLNENGILSRRDLLGLKSRHLLGLEGNLPVIPEDDHYVH